MTAGVVDEPVVGETRDGDAFVEIQDMTVQFPTGRRRMFGRRESAVVTAVDGLTLDIRRGETMALVGESGCGKSTTARAILRLQETSRGSVRIGGEDITGLSKESLRRFRRRMQMVFQDPRSSLNPRMSILETLAEPLTVHGIVGRSELAPRVRDLLGQVGLNPEWRHRYPHQLSGGQRQRVAIARALAVRPDFIVADEPTSALDASVQAQILNLMRGLQVELGLTYLFITHDLGVVSNIADRVAIMYLGKIVEVGPTSEVLTRPLHPYSRALLSAVPLSHPTRERQRRRVVLAGELPSPTDPPSGCRFHTRCPIARDVCAVDEPDLEAARVRRRVACHFWAEELGV